MHSITLIFAPTKCIAALHVFIYDSVADSTDDYIKMEKSSILECLEHFCTGVILCFCEKYSCCHTINDIRHLLVTGEERRFSGMIEGID